MLFFLKKIMRGKRRTDPDQDKTWGPDINSQFNNPKFQGYTLICFLSSTSCHYMGFGV